MIAVNWGTTNFRAFKIDGAGNVEAARSSARGAAGIARSGFLDALLLEVGDWIEAGESRILMSGMVGARNGWKEVSYVPVPATCDELAAGVTRVAANSLDVRIVPGLIGADRDGVPEVMRGEETEILGCASAHEVGTLMCLPGTHTKWVRMEGERIISFSTAMTGDVFNALRKETILRGMTAAEPADREEFLRGVARSRQPGALAHHLFGVRTLVLTGRMKEEASSSYLSGLLIGHEVREMTTNDRPVRLIGDTALCGWYAAALKAFGIEAKIEPEGAALRGLLRIAERLSW